MACKQEVTKRYHECHHLDVYCSHATACILPALSILIALMQNMCITTMEFEKNKTVVNYVWEIISHSL